MLTSGQLGQTQRGCCIPSTKLSQGPARSLGNADRRRRKRMMRKGTTALHAVTQTAMDHSVSVLGDNLQQRGAGWRKIRPARLRVGELSLTKTFQLFIHIFHFEKDSFPVKSKNLEMLGRKGAEGQPSQPWTGISLQTFGKPNSFPAPCATAYTAFRRLQNKDHN